MGLRFIEPPKRSTGIECVRARRPTRVRVQSAAKKIMGFAKVHGLIEHSPFADIDFEQGFAPHKEQKRPAITDDKECGTLLRKLDAYEGRADNLTYYALQLLALTFVRPGTVQKASGNTSTSSARSGPSRSRSSKWSTCAPRSAKPRMVSWCRCRARQLKLLSELHEITGEDRYLFPGDRGARTISENTLNYVLWGLGYKGVHCAHGFRSSASTIWSNG